MSQRHEAFDAGDPFDAMAESVRRQVVDISIKMHKVALYDDLPPVKQLECLMAGLVTGLVGVCFASIQPHSRDEMMKAIIDYLPQARENIEDMMKL